MNISGIRIQAGFYDYNTIKNTQIQEESVPNVIDTAGEDTRVAEVTESERDNKPDHGATEYAKQYQPDAEYDLKGIASDITSLDVEKAISDMKKDQVLQQYQFFVGERMSQTGLLYSVCSLSNLFFRFHTTTLTEACSNELKQHHL